MATTITVVCPNCSNKMRASSDYIGRQGRCPSCKSLVEIIAPSVADPLLATTYPVSGETEGEPKRASSSTEAHSWLAGLIGVGATALLYFVVFLPLKSTMVGKLFLERGPIPFVVVLVTCWGLSMLVLKFFAVKKQQSYANLELELIPLEIGLQITPDNVDQFLSHLEKAPASQRDSIVGRRIHGALEHFKSRNSVPEVQQYLSTQAEIDASGVDAGYTLLRVFIWAVPILGFIGTVMGISSAVSELSTSLGGGGEIGEKLKEALGGVTSGLATAFDTTLIALAMAIVLLFPTESLRKSEYHMLDRIEGFANEQLLRRMSDERAALDLEQLPDVVKDSLQGAFQEHQRWLAQWQAQVSELGRVVGSDFEQAVVRIQNRLSADERDRIDRVEQSSQMLGEVFEKMMGALQAEIGRLANTLQQRDGGAVDDTSSVAQSQLAEIKPVDLELEDHQPPPASDGGARVFGSHEDR